MGRIRTARELAAAAVNVAENFKTLYVMGCFGAPMTDYGKKRYSDNHEYNRKKARKEMILGAAADTFGFDCGGLFKGLLWGWRGDAGHKYGGAEYGAGGVPDVGANQLIAICRDVSTDFSRIQIGECLWLKGHVGIYIGNGRAVECTPGWKNGVQITAVKNIRSGTGHNWTKHGKIPWVTYEDGAEEETLQARPGAEKVSGKTYAVALPLVREGDEGAIVETVQLLCKALGCDPGDIDGEFGPRTKEAVKQAQHKAGKTEDGEVGGETWPVLLKVG